MGTWQGCMAAQAFVKGQAAGVTRRPLAGSRLLAVEEHEALQVAELSISAGKHVGPGTVWPYPIPLWRHRTIMVCVSKQHITQYLSDCSTQNW